MVIVDSTQTDLKLFENEQPREPQGSPLDYPYINGQKRKTQKCKNRFPDRNRWYSLAFREFAEHAACTNFSFLGVNWIGEIVCADGKFSPRWCREYQRRSYAQIYSFAESCMTEQNCAVDDLGHISASSVWLVTLTVQHSCTQSYRSMRETVENLRKSWNDIRRWVNAQKFRYLRVMEPGEINGYPHYHMVVIGADKDTVERLICRWLIACDKNGNKASVKGQDYRQADSIQNVGAYVCKYIQKSFQPDSDGTNMRIWWRWMELAYREHIRVYAMDRKSSRYIAKKYPRKDTGVCEIEIHSDFIERLEDEDKTDHDEQTAPPDIPPIPHYCPLGRSACAGGVCEGRYNGLCPTCSNGMSSPPCGGNLSKLENRLTHVPPFMGGFVNEVKNENL